MEIKRGQRISQGLARKKRRTEIATKAGLYVLASLVLAGGIIYGLNRDEILISEIIVEGEEVISEETIKEFTNTELSKKYLWSIPKKNAFLYPRKKIESGLSEQFKRLDSVSVGRSSLKALTVSIEERKERYLWCGAELVKTRTSATQCYLSDSGGYIFSEAPYYSGSLFFEFYGGLSEEPATGPVGGTILTEEKFSVLISFIEKLGELGLAVQKISVKADGDYELYLEGGGKVLINSKNDIAKGLENLSIALESDPLKKKMVEERAGLDYLDVRFGNKVFFKFK